MKNKKDNEKIWLRIWSIIREYKKYFLIVFICLVGISFMTFLQPLRSVYKELHADRETGC